MNVYGICMIATYSPYIGISAFWLYICDDCILWISKYINMEINSSSSVDWIQPCSNSWPWAGGDLRHTTTDTRLITFGGPFGRLQGRAIFKKTTNPWDGDGRYEMRLQYNVSIDNISISKLGIHFGILKRPGWNFKVGGCFTLMGGWCLGIGC